MFVERFPTIAERSLGEDWPYAGWYVEMLGVAESGHFPMAFNDWDDLSAAPVLQRSASATRNGHRRSPCRQEESPTRREPPPLVGAIDGRT